MFDIKKKLKKAFLQESIPIFWDDLTWQKQMELREALGGNGNYAANISSMGKAPASPKESLRTF